MTKTKTKTIFFAFFRVKLFQGGIFFSMNIFGGQYFSGLNIFQGEYFSDANIFTVYLVLFIFSF